MSITISTKVPEELAERIADEQEEGESRSATVRRLIRDGLDAEEPDPHTVSFPILLMWFGSLAIAAQYVEATGALGLVGLFALLTGALLTRETLVGRVKAVTSRYTDSDEDTGSNA